VPVLTLLVLAVIFVTIGSKALLPFHRSPMAAATPQLRACPTCVCSVAEWSRISFPMPSNKVVPR
jgi:hypothetical protein